MTRTAIAVLVVSLVACLPAAAADQKRQIGNSIADSFHKSEVGDVPVLTDEIFLKASQYWLANCLTAEEDPDCVIAEIILRGLDLR